MLQGGEQIGAGRRSERRLRRAVLAIVVDIEHATDDIGVAQDQVAAPHEKAGVPH